MPSKECVDLRSGTALELCLMLLAVGIAAALQPVQASDYKRDVIYQIVTDRFCNGKAENDDPPQSKGIFDSEHKNWHAYWGGDLAGIKQKLTYIKDLGATAIWISPAIDNVNKPTVDANSRIIAPYHGYHARDFKRIEEHFGDKDNSWSDFDDLVKAAHSLNIKVIVDMPANHTSEYNHGEYGVLYDDGHFKCESNYDKMKYFHHLPLISDWNNRYQLQYGTLSYLADLDQEHPFVDRYLKASALKFQQHGADGVRLDAAKHITWGWEYTLANTLYQGGDHLIMAEWWMNGVSEPLYQDAVKFANKSGISLIDFPLAFALRKAFAPDGRGDFTDVDKTVQQEQIDLHDPNGLLTFIDNHDMPRFLSINNDQSSLRLALALLFSCRGVPMICYGTEQNLHNDTNGGDDPYDRPWMSSFDETAPTYKLIKSLSGLRSSNLGFVYGDQHTLAVSKDSYCFERRFGDSVVVVGINKNPEKSMDSVGIKTSMPDGEYPDQLAGELRGQPLKVNRGTATITLAPSSFSVWTLAKNSDRPIIASVRPPVVNGGIPVTVSGTGFGAASGRVKVANEYMNVIYWSDTSIKFSAPHLVHGGQKVCVERRDGTVSNGADLQIAESKLIPIRFIVAGPALKSTEEQLFITGNVLSLGDGKTSWNDAAGPMLLSEDGTYILCTPMPSGQDVQLKLIVLDKGGNLVREESGNHRYHVPGYGSWSQKLKWIE